jgi:hypothetical protein
MSRLKFCQKTEALMENCLKPYGSPFGPLPLQPKVGFGCFPDTNGISTKNKTFVLAMSKQSEKSRNKQVGSIVEVGFMAGFISRKDAFNTKAFEEIRQKEVGHVIAQKMFQGLDKQYEVLLGTFKSRFDENPEIFEGIEASEVFTVFEHVAHLMLLFFPSRISADVTFDASILMQGHYGSYRTYLEIFIPKDTDQPYHSTLNIYADQTLIFTGGGGAKDVLEKFVQIIRPLFEKTTRLELTF